jgi:hypothetical protein
MKLFRRTVVKSPATSINADAWVNWITSIDPPNDLLIVWLPSYGMEYSMIHDEVRYSQRGFFFNIRTGDRGKATRVVDAQYVNHDVR